MSIQQTTPPPRQVTWDTDDAFVERGEGNIEYVWLVVAVVICGIYLVLVIISWIIACCYCCKRRRRSKKEHMQMEEKRSPDKSNNK